MRTTGTPASTSGLKSPAVSVKNTPITPSTRPCRDQSRKWRSRSGGAVRVDGDDVVVEPVGDRLDAAHQRWIERVGDVGHDAGNGHRAVGLERLGETIGHVAQFARRLGDALPGLGGNRRRPPPLSTIETVACETPARRATSFCVARLETSIASLIRISDTYQRQSSRMVNRGHPWRGKSRQGKSAGPIAQPRILLRICLRQSPRL